MSAPPVLTFDSIPTEEGLSLDLVLDPAWAGTVFAGTDFEAAGPGEAALRLDVDGRDVTLSGNFALPATAECVACLERFPLRLAGEFTLVLEPAEKARGRQAAKGSGSEVELTRDELDTDVYSDGKIDLAHWLREQILLEAPVHPRHEGECPRPLVAPDAKASGGHLSDRLVEASTVDPRLAPLLSFVTKNPKKE